jgi:phage regulator Rha-like protein
MDGQTSLIPVERIERAILLIRGEKVMLDTDLAELYGVETRVLNQAVKRNVARFPVDFMFQLTAEEAEAIRRSRSQSVILKRGENIKFLPYAFTEHGALMLANVLNSERAAQTSVQVVRAFVRLRQMLSSNAELARKLAALENKYDRQFKVVFDAIRQLMSPPPAKPRREIGFHVKYDDDKPKAKKR